MSKAGKNTLRGSITVPGDKSISHRAVMLGSISDGVTRADNFLMSEDCLSTVACFRDMGVGIDITDKDVVIHGVGLNGLLKPSKDLYTGNSGTTTRIISGILAGQDFDTVLNGDESIQKRPMKRVMEPLSMMGAEITSIRNNGCTPLAIKGHQLNGMTYKMKIASAQVKSAILLAGLYAKGDTVIIEDVPSRNHTELMLKGFGADIETDGQRTVLRPGKPLKGMELTVPGDISSAAFFIGAALITEGSDITIRNVGINPTRDGIIRAFLSMGADITLSNEKIQAGERSADIRVRYSKLSGTVIEGDIIPALIDEIPLIAVAATQAEGETVIRNAAELRVKESDRIELVSGGLKKMGASITPTEDGFVIQGPSKLHGSEIRTQKDHRIAMSFSVAGLISDGPVVLDDTDCVNISYPEFYADLEKLKV
ncbi:MAG: 3-phosphoshikimate 1-carboxyvinyltransferase [Lachnospiraceae bacterium]|nr:3-phosphoshikimate 1-carboxyvinyltransferase [Lachnospiraceae bacterium]